MLAPGDFIRITAIDDPFLGDTLVGAICEVTAVSADGNTVNVIANGRYSTTLEASEGAAWAKGDICEVVDTRMPKIMRAGFDGNADAGATGLRHLHQLSAEAQAVPANERCNLVVKMASLEEITAFWEAEQDLIDTERPYPETEMPCPPHILPFLHAWLDGNYIIFVDSGSTGEEFYSDFEVSSDEHRALLQECLEAARANGWEARIDT
jgi:hypothetical protein